MIIGYLDKCSWKQSSSLTFLFSEKKKRARVRGGAQLESLNFKSKIQGLESPGKVNFCLKVLELLFSYIISLILDLKYRSLKYFDHLLEK